MSSLEFNQRVVGVQTSMFYFALHLTRSDQDAHDLVQEALLKALTYKDKFKEGTNFKAWVQTIMKNIFINDHRRALRGRAVLDNVEHEKNQWRSAQYGPESEITVRNIHNHIDALEEEYRVPFQMHLEGYRYHEIADRVNIPIGTVKSRIFHARKVLTAALEGLRN